ncbi:MAG: roadblock/LC7 domain-containing protein [Anaerolineales bacterium]|jgi:predicted regulator of Ras-like GTPase activity (Roadblock/LC7/MglB family)
MTEDESGWEALFNPDDDFDSQPTRGAYSGKGPGASLGKYLDLPGVRGAIRVTLDGVVLHHQVPGDVEYYAALTASIGSTARRVDRLLSLGGYEYAVVRMASDSHSTMIILDGDTFVGLLLSGEIAPTHIVTRLQNLGSERLG